MNFYRSRSVFACETCAARLAGDHVQIVVDVLGDGEHMYTRPRCPVCDAMGIEARMTIVRPAVQMHLPEDFDGAPHIVLSTVMRDPMVTLAFHRSVMRAPAVLQRAGIAFSENIMNGGAIQYQRNRLVAGFLNQTKASHLLFVDDDVGFDAADLVRMLEADRDVVAGVYATREIDWEAVGRRARESDATPAELARGSSPLAFRPLRDADGRVTVEGDLIEAEYVPTGFLLIKRHVLEQMNAAYPELAYWSDEDKETHHACFEARIVDGRPMTEDFVWARRWRAIGGRIWVHGRAAFGHNGHYEFRAHAPLEQLERARAASEAPPASAEVAAQ